MNPRLSQHAATFPDVVELKGERTAQRIVEHPCPVCHRTEVQPRYAISDFPFELVTCSDCGTGRVDPLPRRDQIASFYPEEYYGVRGAKFQGHVERLVRFVAAHRLRFLVRGLPAGARVLDVGCGRGVLLDALARNGYQPSGVEISAEAAAGVDPRWDVRVAATLTEARFEAATFEAVIIWHVLEHLPDPRETLREVARILKPGGRLVIAVPNFSSWQARWSGPAWFHLDLPRHLYHFPLPALKRLLEASGFESVAEHHFSLRQNPFGWVQSLLNKNPRMPRNGLYTMLHRRDGGASAEPYGRAQRTRFWVYYWIGMPVALVISVVAALLRNGATVHVDARRRA